MDSTPVFINDIKETLENQTNDFINFLVDKKVIAIGIGLLLASQLSIFVNTFVNTVVNPIIRKILKNDQGQKLEQLKITYFEVEFELGKLITSLINFMIILFVIYLIYKLELRLTKK